MHRICFHDADFHLSRLKASRPGCFTQGKIPLYPVDGRYGATVILNALEKPSCQEWKQDPLVVNPTAQSLYRLKPLTLAGLVPAET